MTAVLRHHAYSLTRALSRLRAAPMSAAFNALVIGIALALPFGASMLLASAQDVLAGAAGKAEVSVFLAKDAGPPDAEQIGKRLRATAGVASVRFVSKDAALAELKHSAGIGEVASALRDNPLPDAYVATLTSQDPALADSIAASAKSWEKVVHAQADSAWLRRMQSFMRAARTGIGLLGGLLALALVAVVFNTVRLQVLTQRDEVEVSRLVGATDAFVRRPFLYLGALQGLLGALVAWILVWSALRFLQADVAEVGSLFGGAAGLQLPGSPEAALLFGFAAVLGWSGALLSVSKHLREIR